MKTSFFSELVQKAIGAGDDEVLMVISQKLPALADVLGSEGEGSVSLIAHRQPQLAHMPSYLVPIVAIPGPAGLPCGDHSLPIILKCFGYSTLFRSAKVSQWEKGAIDAHTHKYRIGAKRASRRYAAQVSPPEERGARRVRRTRFPRRDAAYR
ncbi:unnamed protein product [Schistocephalus solidus]|uniref:CCT domain-containing protein n=1 Tax=Schistocephalus solidus TaxID=70667 RepID=A0A183SVX2_SCHSO|nr:unnamed protein product [Schistocephalus solidus]